MENNTVIGDRNRIAGVSFFSPLNFHYCSSNAVWATERRWVPKNKMPDKIWPLPARRLSVGGVPGRRCSW